MKIQSILPILLIGIVGCKGNEAPATSSAGSTGGGQPGAQTIAPPVAPKPAELPASIKHAGFEYYGLGNQKPMDVTLKAPDVPEKTGGVQVTLDKVEGNQAYFKVARTGAIAEDLGDDTVMVDATGVYMAGTSIGTISPEKFLAMPANPTPGKTWKLQTKVTRKDGQEIQENSTYKVEGIRDVKTKNGNQRALLVTSDGTANVSMGTQTQKAKYQTKSWYVKGVGPVRIEIALTATGQPTRTLVVEQSP